MSHPAELICVSIIEDQAEIRQGLSVLIGGTPGYRCLGTYRSVEAALGCLREPYPHVILIDIGLPGMSGIEGTRVLKDRCPQTQMVVLTVHEDDKHIFEAICAGAAGYLLKNTPPAKLLEGIRDVLDGGAPMSPSIARRVIALFRDFRPPQHVDYDLTPHELRVLSMLVEGHNFKTAAQELGVTRHAVTFHMRHVYEKLQVHSKSEAVAKALRERLVR
jgi:DNA-binding NarL/FixJ family response regulator